MCCVDNHNFSLFKNLKRDPEQMRGGEEEGPFLPANPVLPVWDLCT